MLLKSSFSLFGALILWLVPFIGHCSESVSIANKNLAAGEAFLAKNQKQPGVHTLPSGLQYKILTEGEGTPPEPTDFVVVNYRGTFIDGTEFDSSRNQHKPATLALNATIPGWIEALQLMKPGAKWILYLPPKLAYGAQGVGHLIPPNATLIFEIELIAVKPALDEGQDGFDEELGDDK